MKIVAFLPCGNLIDMFDEFGQKGVILLRVGIKVRVANLIASFSSPSLSKRKYPSESFFIFTLRFLIALRMGIPAVHGLKVSLKLLPDADRGIAFCAAVECDLAVIHELA
ncbi:hypothetical protein SAMN04487825_12148 [Prevotella sp. kh1p2]|nr:hypothetical protein SAMN04487825_12148 [Prevotella sp. kh1p2]SNU12298.1 hypothetical protein SAMN06298210_12216 [Prevotellaceae bacterium KH2P17]